jgi:hypothetical protein
MIVRNDLRLVVRRPGSSDLIHMVAHSVLHAKLLTKVLNACDLSDKVISARRVLDLLLFTVSPEFGACDHIEHNMQLQVQAFRSWLLYTIERHVDIAAALCSGASGEPQISSLIEVCPCVCLCVNVRACVCVHVRAYLLCVCVFANRCA